MSTRLRARRTGHDNVDPWDPATTPDTRHSLLRWLWPLGATLTVAAIAAALWWRWPEAPAAEALVPLALLVPAVLVGRHRLGRRRQRVRNTLRRVSDDLDQDRWRDAVRQLREEPLGAPSAFGSMIASGRAPAIAATSAAVICPSSGLTRTSVMTSRVPDR